MSPINGRLLYYKFITREHLPIMNFLSSRDLFVSGNLRHRLILVESLIKKPLHSTAPKCGLFLILIFPYLYRIVSVFSRIWTNSKILSIYRKLWIRFCPYTRKCRSQKAGILSCTIHVIILLTKIYKFVMIFNALIFFRFNARFCALLMFCERTFK